MTDRRWWVVALMLVAACSNSDRPAANAGGNAEPATPRAPEQAVSTAGWTVTPTGIGTVRVEMTLAQAGRQLGRELTAPAGTERCVMMPAGAGLDSVLFMAIDGRIARVDVTGGRIATREGARVGDAQAHVESLYTGRVEVQPHKYTDGKYLVVRPTERADSAYRLVFETDGNRVTRYRAGRLPEVQWVEGCS